MRRYIVIAVSLAVIIAAGAVLVTGCKQRKVVSAQSLSPYKPKPIPAEGKPIGKDVFKKKLHEFNRRMFVGAYQKYGDRNHESDEAVVKFFDGYVTWMNTNGKGAALPGLIKQGEALVDGGCKDPLLTTCVGIAMYRNRQYAEAASFLERGLAGFRSKEVYPGYCASLAPKYLILNLRETRQPTPADSGEWMPLTTKWMAKAQVDGSFEDDEMDLRVTFTVGNNIFPESQWRSLYNAMKEQSGVDPYLLNLILGVCEIKAAWADRGGDWAYKVTEEGWEGFRKHLEIARRALTKAWELHPEYPYAPANMIAVAMGGMAGPGETPRMWFDRAVAAQWDYPEAYGQLLCALLPRWGGSVDEIFAFAEECVNTRRYDSPIPWYFISLVRTIENEEGNTDCWKRPETFKLLNEVTAGYEKTGFDHTPQWYKSARAALEWYAGRDDEAKRLIDELGDDLVSAAFYSTIEVSYDTVKKVLESGGKMWEPVQWSENGHYYQMCRPTVGRTWDEAKAAAEEMTHDGKKGHLVAFNSGAERDFVSGIPNVAGLYLIGALKSASGGKKGEGWTWTTGEPWKFSFSGDHEANQSGTSDLVGGLTTDGTGTLTWLTFSRDTSLSSGFIVEYE